MGDVDDDAAGRRHPEAPEPDLPPQAEAEGDNAFEVPRLFTWTRLPDLGVRVIGAAPALARSILVLRKTTWRNAAPGSVTGRPEPSWITRGTYLADHAGVPDRNSKTTRSKPGWRPTRTCSSTAVRDVVAGPAFASTVNGGVDAPAASTSPISAARIIAPR